MATRDPGTASERPIFLEGPLPRLWRWALRRHVGPPAPLREALLVMLVTWAPLAVLAAAQGLAMPFFADISVPARFLLAAPILLASEPLCLDRLERIARNFRSGGLVREKDTARFDAAAAAAAASLRSVWTEAAILCLAFVGIGSLHSSGLGDPSGWRLVGGTEGQTLSWAAWWLAWVSRPILWMLVFAWLWRGLVWGRLLWVVSRLDLRLVPAHPDLTGGLRFVGNSLRAWAPVGLAVGCMLSGPILNRVIYDRQEASTFVPVPICLVAGVLLLFVGPLLLFVRRLLDAKAAGVLEYGDLALAHGTQFERKWLRGGHPRDETMLEAPDFSATTDLYQVAGNVYSMQALPLDMSSLKVLLVSALLPFAPVVLAGVPLDDLIKKIFGLLV